MSHILAWSAITADRIRKNVSTIRELYPISNHVTSTVTLRIFKHVHPLLLTLTRECRVTKKFKSYIWNHEKYREMWRRSDSIGFNSYVLSLTPILLSEIFYQPFAWIRLPIAPGILDMGHLAVLKCKKNCCKIRWSKEDSTHLKIQAVIHDYC